MQNFITIIKAFICRHEEQKNRLRMIAGRCLNQYSGCPEQYLFFPPEGVHYRKQPQFFTERQIS